MSDQIDKATSNNQENDRTEEYANMITTTLASRGTFGYYSPESKQKIYYPSSDVYSVGSTLLHLLSCHPDDIENRKEFISNHKNNNFDPNHIKISTNRYSDHLINFVKKLLIATPQNRLSLDDLIGETVNQHTQRITSFLIDRRQILSSTTTLILDGEFNSPLKGLLPPTLLKLKLFGKFNQPIKQGDIPNSVETLIFGSSFNREIYSSLRQLKVLYFSKSFDRRLPELDLFGSRTFVNITSYYSSPQRNANVYHFNVHGEIAHLFKNGKPKTNIILAINQKYYGIGVLTREKNIIKWQNNDISISIDQTNIGVVSNVQASIYPHLFCQTDKSKFEEFNKQYGSNINDVDYPLDNMADLFELDEDNLHQVFKDGQYLNIRFIPMPQIEQEKEVIDDS
ncbi:hypothetical protein DFA_06981 [Cavenderia fasciculata]|uniref:Protein kinase domain-containing protein n=1 Tax=Cavenderia fasciculata TaxID=261658 RepID=F4PX75_CACFS|nr:uncharacterized protein DFA_06981 [Cavenderia fasciculata]EGG19878.1 hypothetical protein DFA_06981 [Cavenderia fasciculata]|eukprot:XP_004366861.1 hypothetical protein DFA_06981 [Cavenderia fasciculata]